MSGTDAVSKALDALHDYLPCRQTPCADCVSRPCFVAAARAQHDREVKALEAADELAQAVARFGAPGEPESATRLKWIASRHVPAYRAARAEVKQ